MTLIELLLVLVMASLVLVAAMAYSIPWLARESTRGAAFDVQTFIQLARIEAVTRNHGVKLELESDLKRLQVIDDSTSEVLYEADLPESISFADPSAGTPITLASVSGTLYRLTFSSDGTVSAGQGVVTLFGGDVYQRVSVFLAGGVQVDHWSGSGWEAGS